MISNVSRKRTYDDDVEADENLDQIKVVCVKSPVAIKTKPGGIHALPSQVTKGQGYTTSRRGFSLMSCQLLLSPIQFPGEEPASDPRSKYQQASDTSNPQQRGPGALESQATSSSPAATSAANVRAKLSKLVIIDSDLTMGGMLTREVMGGEGYVIDSSKLTAAIDLIKARTKKYGEFEVNARCN